jgi:hypothetical protein
MNNRRSFIKNASVLTLGGNWWKGSLDEFAPAYSILDLYEDGSSHYETTFYNWNS